MQRLDLDDLLYLIPAPGEACKEMLDSNFTQVQVDSAARVFQSLSLLAVAPGRSIPNDHVEPWPFDEWGLDRLTSFEFSTWRNLRRNVSPLIPRTCKGERSKCSEVCQSWP